VVVDVQNDFADPAGSLYVSDGEGVVAPVNRLVGRAQAASSLVVYTQDWHPPQTPHFVTGGGVWPVHCVRDTWGAQLHPGLAVPDGAPIVRKGTGGEDGYSGFSMRDESGAVRGTGLDELLRAAGVRRVVVVGIAGDVCVAATASDAVARGYRTAVVRDAVRSVNRTPGDDERAFAELVELGVHVD